jgi:hypothetical protein
MKIIEVATKEQKKEFLEFPKRHYKNDPNWICPLDAEINGIFNPQVNKKFQHGEAIRWLLVDENSKTIGRIAAFYDKHIVNHFKFPTGGCGFFECIDNQAAAETLFDAARKWLIDKGMQAMQGPINFGENYNHWGFWWKDLFHRVIQCLTIFLTISNFSKIMGLKTILNN